VVVIALFVVVFACMLIEARRAARNERTQRARGGIEPSGDVYRIMRFAYPAAFVTMLAEGAAREASPIPAVAAGGILFVVAKTLKWWAIVALGTSWTFRLIVVSGAALVTSGPYRWLRHPNYLAVLGELVGVALMSGARVTGPIATVAFGLLILRRMAVENRALGAILRRS
jgi:methyltransferase